MELATWDIQQYHQHCQILLCFLEQVLREFPEHLLVFAWQSEHFGTRSLTRLLDIFQITLGIVELEDENDSFLSQVFLWR